MSFDWIELFEARGTSYKTRSPNAGRGEIVVKCPFCGPADPSEHMSISLTGGGWVCRRNRIANPPHAGRAPQRLIRALYGCSAAEADRIVGKPAIASPDDLMGQVEALVRGEPEPAGAANIPELHELKAFKKFGTGLPSERVFRNYMVGRGFDYAFLRRASDELGLRYCTLGPFRGRVVFLVRQGGRLVNWTGRSIWPQAHLRYRALSPDPAVAAESGLPAAAHPIEQCLLWYDDLQRGGDRLEVVEGPMDALKLRMLGRRATCLFTNTASRSQVDLLREVAPRFERRVVMLDRGAEAEAVHLLQELAALDFVLGWLPSGVDDPGELTKMSVRDLRY